MNVCCLVRHCAKSIYLVLEDFPGFDPAVEEGRIRQHLFENLRGSKGFVILIDLKTTALSKS